MPRKNPIARTARPVDFYKGIRCSRGMRRAPIGCEEEVSMAKPLAMITGASTGIGLELARCAAHAGYDLAIAAEEPEIEEAARSLRALGVDVIAIEANLATREGVDRLCDVVGARPVEVLMANAGRGLGHAFLD